MKVKTRDDKETIHETVRDAYASRVKLGGCCGPAKEEPSVQDFLKYKESALKMGYSQEDLAAVPEGANLGLGCGAPLAIAKVQAGETVLDLGSGAGFDAFIASQVVGPEGRVIGVDMTPEMIAQAQENAAKAGVENVEFRHGYIEEMPVENNTVDVLISNCVINLSPDKPAVFREAFRVLRPGGRVAVSDIVLTAPLPPAIAENMAAYVGCVAGASLLDEYLGYLREAGFENIEVASTQQAVESLPEDDPIVLSVLEATGSCCVDELSAEIKGIAGRVLSAKITARKP
jgi:ubiquinone/menaquinone biosynthesis C-methylase UbiE